MRRFQLRHPESVENKDLIHNFQAVQDDIKINLNWIIRILTRITSRSNLRARLRRRPTENQLPLGEEFELSPLKV